MMLEVLFAQAGQGRAFLLMVLCGAATALLVHITTPLRRAHGLAGLAADALCALLVTLGLGQAVLWTGTLRACAVLGLLIGGGLYLWGGAPLVRWLMGRKRQPR